MTLPCRTFVPVLSPVAAAAATATATTTQHQQQQQLPPHDSNAFNTIIPTPLHQQGQEEQQQQQRLAMMRRIQAIAWATLHFIYGSTRTAALKQPIDAHSPLKVPSLLAKEILHRCQRLQLETEQPQPQQSYKYGVFLVDIQAMQEAGHLASSVRILNDLHTRLVQLEQPVLPPLMECNAVVETIGRLLQVSCPVAMQQWMAHTYYQTQDWAAAAAAAATTAGSPPPPTPNTNMMTMNMTTIPTRNPPANPNLQASPALGRQHYEAFMAQTPMVATTTATGAALDVASTVAALDLVTTVNGNGNNTADLYQHQASSSSSPAAVLANHHHHHHHHRRHSAPSGAPLTASRSIGYGPNAKLVAMLARKRITDMEQREQQQQQQQSMLLRSASSRTTPAVNDIMMEPIPFREGIIMVNDDAATAAADNNNKMDDMNTRRCSDERKKAAKVTTNAPSTTAPAHPHGTRAATTAKDSETATTDSPQDVQDKNETTEAATAAESSPEPLQVLLWLQRRFLQLLHASRCKTTDGSCPPAMECPETKLLVQHVQACKDVKCRYGSCLSSRCALRHAAILQHIRACCCDSTDKHEQQQQAEPCTICACVLEGSSRSVRCLECLQSTAADNKAKASAKVKKPKSPVKKRAPSPKKRVQKTKSPASKKAAKARSLPVATAPEAPTTSNRPLKKRRVSLETVADYSDVTVVAV